ncbi:MAG TPA: GNAT family N-acetyltransferase [Stellaceae bacterium]
MADPAAPRIEPLDAGHDRTGFACGNEALDRYFQTQVTQDARRRLASAFVMIMPEGGLGGFYTLSSASLRLADLPQDVARRLPRYPLVPATLIGRLAIDRRYHGQGWGGFLLLDALHRCVRSDIASFAVLVDAIDDGAHAFYLHHSFLPLPDQPRRLFRRISDIAALFQ